MKIHFQAHAAPFVLWMLSVITSKVIFNRSMVDRMCRIFFAGCLCLGSVVQTALAESPVWTVSNGENTIYLAGTLHVLKAEDFPLPAQFKQAYQSSDDVYFEVDLVQFNSDDVQSQLSSRVAWNDGTTLEDVLSPPVLQRLQAQLDNYGIPLGMIAHYKPGPAAITVSMLEMQRLGMSEAGVEDHVMQWVSTDDRDVFGLETAEKQISFLLEMGGSTPDDIIGFTIDDLSGLEEQVDILRTAWRSGDVDEIDQSILHDMRSAYPKIYQQLIVERNNNWIPELKALLADSDTEMVLVGIGHLAGPDSLLKLLAAQGYRIRQLK